MGGRETAVGIPSGLEGSCAAERRFVRSSDGCNHRHSICFWGGKICKYLRRMRVMGRRGTAMTGSESNYAAKNSNGTNEDVLTSVESNKARVRIRLCWVLLVDATRQHPHVKEFASRSLISQLSRNKATKHHSLLPILCIFLLCTCRLLSSIVLFMCCHMSLATRSSPTM
jgi:hypothetical protein